MDVVGFVGLGSIGAPMAQRLIASGRPTLLWARHPESAAPFADGPAIIVDDVTELGRRCDVVGLCVR
ncbi:MAG: NAD(P)-binding domain-containing protein, partial [Ilumatobacteraceae bacterium]